MKKIMQNKIPEHKSIIFWLIMCFVTVFMFVAPFYKGLFNGGEYSFERPIYIVLAWSAGALFIVALYLFNHWKLNNHKDVVALAIWLIPLCYLIPMFNAASYHLAMNELYIHIVYALFFLIGAYFSRNMLGAAVLQYGLIGSGYMLVIHGLLNWFGNVHYTHAVLENRLSGVFQYPNSYAAYLIGILVACLIISGKSKKWYTIIPNAFMLVPITVSILFTLSRGAMVIFPIAVLVYLLFIPWRRQLFELLYLVIAGVSSLAIYNKLTSIQLQLSQKYVGSVSLKGWTILIILSLCVAVIVYIIQKFIAIPLYLNFSTNKLFKSSNAIIPLSFATVAIFGAYLFFGNNTLSDNLPDGIKQRIESLNSEDSSIASRGVFYKDSIKIANDYPFFGAGGGAWASLYDKYKSYPYSSRQTHNVISQVLVDTGIIGLAIFTLLIGYCWYLFVRYAIRQSSTDWNENWLIFPLFGLILLLHSVIDFDMSFVYLSSLVFLSLGMMVSVSVPEIKKQTARNSKTLVWGLKGYPVAITVIVVILFVNSMQAVRANTLFVRANDVARATHNYNEIIKPLDAAIKLQPNHSEYVLFKTNMLIQLYEQYKQEQYINEAATLLQGLQRTDPYNRRMIEEQYSLFIAKGEYDNALDWAQSKLDHFPWDINLYEKVITLNFDLGKQAEVQGATANKIWAYWNHALESLDQLNNKINEIHALPNNQGYTFEITPNIALSIAQIYYIQGRFDNISALLKPVLSTNFDFTINRLTARWYLASLQKQNQNDDTLYDSLINKFPDEKQQIEAILANQF